MNFSFIHSDIICASPLIFFIEIVSALPFCLFRLFDGLSHSLRNVKVSTKEYVRINYSTMRNIVWFADSHFLNTIDS